MTRRQRVHQFDDRIRVEAPLIQSIPHQKGRGGCYSYLDTLIQAGLNPTGILSGLHAPVVPVEVQPHLLGISAKDGRRIAGRRPVRLAFIDLFMLLPELALLVGAGR